MAKSAPLVARPIFGLGSIAAAGWFGGPLVIGYLVYRNYTALNLRRRIGLALFMLVVSAAAWLYVHTHVPPDVISQLLPLPFELLVWWLCARYLLGAAHREHSASGGPFRSAWSAIRIGLLVAALGGLASIALTALFAKP